MRLYHFTHPDAVALIQAEGIRPSHIQVPRVGPSPQAVVSSIGNPDPTPLLYKSLWDGSLLTGEVLEAFRISNPGIEVPVGPNTIAKRVIVAIPDEDEMLFAMLHPDLSALGFIDQAHIDEFVQLGGGVPDEWRVYLGGGTTILHRRCRGHRRMKVAKFVRAIVGPM